MRSLYKILILITTMVGMSSSSFGSCQPIDQIGDDPLWVAQCQAVGTSYRSCVAVAQCQWIDEQRIDEQPSCQPIAQIGNDPLWVAQCQAVGISRQACVAVAQCQWVH